MKVPRKLGKWALFSCMLILLLFWAFLLLGRYRYADDLGARRVSSASVVTGGQGSQAIAVAAAVIPRLEKSLRDLPCDPRANSLEGPYVYRLQLTFDDGAKEEIFFTPEEFGNNCRASEDLLQTLRLAGISFP